MNSGHDSPWSRDGFEAGLRALGRRYHIHHPFSVLMNEGKLSREAVQGWVANRFYYQINIPRKDAAVLANCPDRDTRRRWVQRILDHDGRAGDEGGIELWIRLGMACGLARDDIVSLRHVLPGVRFAVDAYVNFARRASWQDAACSSLTELFAPTIHRQRLASWPERYPWIEADGLAYFQNRLGEAHRDVEHGLAITLDHFVTRPEQERALEILKFKLDILWTMLDAMQLAYIDGRPPYFNVEEPGVSGNDLPMDSPLALHTGFRMQYEPAQESHVLLFPEGMITLSGSATEIVKRCDGSRSANGIVADLEAQFPGSELRADVLEFLAVAWGKGWIAVASPGS